MALVLLYEYYLSKNTKVGGDMSDLVVVLRKVEKLRDELNKAVTKKSMRHPDIIAHSQRLDRALNEYYALTRKK